MRGDTLVVDGPAILINVELAEKKVRGGAPMNEYDHKMIKKYFEQIYKENDTLLVYWGGFQHINFEPKYTALESEASCSENFYFICSVDEFGNINFTDNFKDIDKQTGIVEYKNSGSDTNAESEFDQKPSDTILEPEITGTDKAAKDAIYRREMEKENKNKKER